MSLPDRESNQDKVVQIHRSALDDEEKSLRGIEESSQTGFGKIRVG